MWVLKHASLHFHTLMTICLNQEAPAFFLDFTMPKTGIEVYIILFVEDNIYKQVQQYKMILKDLSLNLF
jgi:hypothetical protein